MNWTRLVLVRPAASLYTTVYVNNQYTNTATKTQYLSVVEQWWAASDYETAGMWVILHTIELFA